MVVDLQKASREIFDYDKVTFLHNSELGFGNHNPLYVTERGLSSPNMILCRHCCCLIHTLRHGRTVKAFRPCSKLPGVF